MPPVGLGPATMLLNIVMERDQKLSEQQNVDVQQFKWQKMIHVTIP